MGSNHTEPVSTPLQKSGNNNKNSTFLSEHCGDLVASSIYELMIYGLFFIGGVLILTFPMLTLGMIFVFTPMLCFMYKKLS